MDTADKIGLLPGFTWLADQPFVITLLIVWGITPFLHLVIGRVFESRWVPIRPSQQFLSFFPGDLFLGLMTATLLVRAQSLPSRDAWYNLTEFHLFVLVAALVVASVLTVMELKNGVYPKRAIMSPTKIYHNFVLYGGYGYVIVTTLLSVVFGFGSEGWWLLVIALLPGFVWLFLVYKDNSMEQKLAEYKAMRAHTPHWEPFWR